MSGEGDQAVLPRRRAGLGRGLDALLGENRTETAANEASEAGGALRRIAIAHIRPDPAQPRRHFDETALAELAASIAERGVLQPIVVRSDGARFIIVAGERRWRAAQIAKLTEMPAIVRDYSESQALEVALIENIQREDLNAIEEAEGYRRLCADFGHSAADLGKLVDKSRSHVANLMRLLELPEDVRALVGTGALSMGHARALIGREDAGDIARDVVKRGLTVRQTEALARRGAGSAKAAKPRRAAGGQDADIHALEAQLADLLGLKVRIASRDGAGTITLDFRTLDQLDMLCQRLSGEKF